MTEPLDDARGELLACPLCQSNDLQVGSCYQEGSSERQAAVRCAKCGCRSTLLAWNTRPAPVPQCKAEPVAWDYELATARYPDTGAYAVWRPYLTRVKPSVPDGSIRNLRPLYATQPSRSDAVNAGLRQALEQIAKQMTMGELIAEYGEDYLGDPESGYDAIIMIARAALSSDPGTVAVASGLTAEDIRACARSTLIGFQHELGDRNIEFICDQISRKATLTHSSTHQHTPTE